VWQQIDEFESLFFIASEKRVSHEAYSTSQSGDSAESAVGQITSESKLPQGKHVAIFSRTTLSTLNGTGEGITPRNELFGCVGAKGFDF